MKFIKVDDGTIINVDAIDAIYLDVGPAVMHTDRRLKILTRSGKEFLVMEKSHLSNDAKKAKEVLGVLKKRMNELARLIGDVIEYNF